MTAVGFIYGMAAGVALSTIVLLTLNWLDNRRGR